MSDEVLKLGLAIIQLIPTHENPFFASFVKKKLQDKRATPIRGSKILLFC